MMRTNETRRIAESLAAGKRIGMIRFYGLRWDWEVKLHCIDSQIVVTKALVIK